MHLECIYHRPGLNWAFAVDSEHVYVRLKCTKADLERVKIVFGDKVTHDEDGTCSLHALPLPFAIVSSLLLPDRCYHCF